MWIREHYKLFLMTMALFFIFDLMYISFNRKMYMDVIDINNLRIIFSIGVWFIMTISLIYFIILNESLTVTQKIMNAAILGFCIHSIYNFTNITIFPKWNINILITDIIWGCILYSIVTYIVLYIKDTYLL
jgi:uncharacterized membrane protein